MSFPIVHSQLLCFADFEMEVVVLAPRYQGSDFLSVGCLIVAGDQANDSYVVSKLDDGVGAVGGHTVIREQGVEERVKHAALRGAGVKSHAEDLVLPVRPAWALPVRKFRIQSVLSSRSLRSLVMSLEGTMVLNAEL